MKHTLTNVAVFLFTAAVLLLVVFYVPLGWLLIPVLFIWATSNAVRALKSRAIRKHA